MKAEEIVSGTVCEDRDGRYLVTSVREDLGTVTLAPIPPDGRGTITVPYSYCLYAMQTHSVRSSESR